MKPEWGWMFEKAWALVKDEKFTDKCKSDLIACLKREGGAASLKDCAEACCLTEKECKTMIATMGNVKMSPYGDAILMDGL